MSSISEQLLDKSKEAFVMAIELYNKPTIHYRLEGFSFFICNAWELMLKAYLIKRDGENSIYFADKPNRTISLENCIQRVFTNEKAPLRLNLSKIVELRNTSTHFITEEYEMVYVPLLQACVFNFVDKMQELHGIDMTEVIPENFITLSVRIKALDETEIRGKYTKQISDKLLTMQRNIAQMIDENNNGFAIRIEHQYYQTKRREEATELFHIARDAEEGARIVKQIKTPNETHKYAAKKCIEEINKRLEKEHITMLCNGNQVKMNTYFFGLFTSYFGMKSNLRFCYEDKIYSQPRYSYSLQAIDFIVQEIKKAPDHILDDLKAKCKKSANPGSKGF